ncbi:hypothetical protein [Nocardia altamirensis]|uniref:hypothetical protein n=1 Tax=Nocardia altamirensis TaxID=472158 RepID=UPI0008403145|nr:hypothetical protein [Nocardia altamirensis]
MTSTTERRIPPDAEDPTDRYPKGSQGHSSGGRTDCPRTGWPCNAAPRDTTEAIEHPFHDDVLR